jgi:two-component system phosphate regulon response regulator PhoB
MKAATDRMGGFAAHAPAFVVDDDIGTLRLLSEVAAAVGLRPVVFTRLSAARRALAERVPAVMLLDDDLPDGRGADFVRELRTDPRTRHVKAIVCTAASADRRRQISSVAPVIAKPFEVSEVEGALREATRR